MTLTPQQHDAVTARGQDVCVVAGPGSGKTGVLIARFRWLVEEELLDPRRILAITFTEKAATQIKKRLVEAFEGRPELRAEIERAWVSTIHGFCARLLKDHAISAGVDPEFVVLDENQARGGLEEAAVATLDRILVEDADRLRALLSRLYVSSDPSGRQPDLAQALIAVYEAMRVAGKSPGELRGAPAAATGPTFEEVCATVRRYLAGAGGGGSEAQRRRVDELRAWLAAAEAGTDPFRALSSFPCTFRGLKAGNPYYDEMMPLRDEAIPAVKAVLIARLNAAEYQLLIEAVRRIDAAWRQRKREMSALDFADLEEAAIRLLREEPEVAGRVRARFDAILMDELQDTNPLQWTLVDLLRRPERFFAVGDVNQSIFGFRHAEPAVFRKYRDAVEAAGHRAHELRQNHRSRAGILEAVNQVFAAAAGVEAHTLFASDKYAPRPEAENKVLAAAAGVEAHALFASDKDAPRPEAAVEVMAAQAGTSAEAAQLEAAWIARRILELNGSLAVGPKGQERPAQFSDFAVLGRSLNALEPIREALLRAGIPALVAGGRTFYETREVLDLTHWLAVVANRRDEVALAGLLRSPLVGVRDETLLRLCTRGRLADSFDGLESLDLAAFDAGDRERLLEARARLERLGGMRDSVAPDRLAAEALDDSDYLSTLTPHGRANVEKFLGLLRGLYTARPRSLRETLDELARLREAASEPEAPPGESSNAVRLMSIHKSKGLEFPVVFVPALQRGTDPSKPVVCFDPVAGLGVRWRDPAGSKGIADSVHRRFVSELEAREKAEENRLLYVAMTRAEERLVLSFGQSPRSGSEWVRLVSQGLGDDRLQVVSQLPDGAGVPASSLEIPAEEILARPRLSGQHDSAVSVTSIASFRSCPRRYFLSRYIGWQGRFLTVAAQSRPDDEEWREADAGEIDPSEFGSQVHALLAGEAVPNPHPEAEALAAAFHRTELGERASRASRAARESAFLFAMDDVVLRGQIDLWFEEAGELVLVDYKTDRMTAAEDQRLEPYRLQLRLYALALEKLLGRLPDRGFLHLLRTGESVPVHFSPASLDHARLAVAEFREAQDRLEFPLCEGKHCSWCEFYKGSCRAGTPSLERGH